MATADVLPAVVHLVYSWENSIVPSFNFDVPRSQRTIEEMKGYVAATGAKLWVNHDLEQHRSIPKSPQYVE